MRTSIITVLFGFGLALGFGCAPENPAADDEETENSDSQRDPIVGGQTTNAFPAVGAITRNGQMHCTGTLVGPRTVVTAAHCVSGFTASSMRFVLGPSLTSPTATLTVASIKANPNYNATQITNDIGILTLAQDAPIAPMKLMSSMDSSWAGKTLTFVGFGTNNGNTQTGYGIKRYVDMAVQSVSATQFQYSVPGKNTCNGDSGGPAFANVNGEMLVAGVTSYGDVNCTQYGVDTRVDAFASFVGASGGSGGTSDPCHGETFAGRCDGNTAIWCENSTVQNQSCSGGKVCGFSTANQYYGCIAPAAQDPCHGETFAGRCDGKKLIWCENNTVKNASCPSSCGFNSSQGYFDCVSQ